MACCFGSMHPSVPITPHPNPHTPVPRSLQILSFSIPIPRIPSQPNPYLTSIITCSLCTNNLESPNNSTHSNISSHSSTPQTTNPNHPVTNPPSDLPPLYSKLNNPNHPHSTTTNHTQFEFVILSFLLALLLEYCDN